MKYHFKAHVSDGECWAECLELEGCLTQGTDLEELKRNAADALNLHLDEPEDSKVIFPMPDVSLAKGKNVFSVEVEPQVAFAVLLRQARIARGLTQKVAAKRLGIESLYNYQRLERRANPTLSTLKKIKIAFPELPFEYVL
ncbi:MAG: type II toxin-antitoxin system HicB family antitoxin [Spirochaetia bacterium]|jgi:predicted RNase H-like HicB family nuclease